MGVIASLFLIIGVIVALVVAFTVLPMVGSALSSSARSTRQELRDSKQRERLAISALRQIANGDSMPVLTAGDALDRIESNYNKELN